MEFVKSIEYEYVFIPLFGRSQSKRSGFLPNVFFSDTGVIASVKFLRHFLARDEGYSRFSLGTIGTVGESLYLVLGSFRGLRFL